MGNKHFNSRGISRGSRDVLQEEEASEPNQQTSSLNTNNNNIPTETVNRQNNHNNNSHLSSGNSTIVTSLNNFENYEIYIQNIISQLESDDALMKYGISKEDACIAIEQTRGMMELHGKKWLPFIDHQLLQVDITDLQRQDLIENISKFNLEKILISVLMEIRAMVKMSEIRERNNLLNISTPEVCFLVFYTFKFALERSVDEVFLELISKIRELGVDGVKFNEFLVHGTLDFSEHPNNLHPSIQNHPTNDEDTHSLWTYSQMPSNHDDMHDTTNSHSIHKNNEESTTILMNLDAIENNNNTSMEYGAIMNDHSHLEPTSYLDEHLLNALRELIMPRTPQRVSGEFSYMMTEEELQQQLVLMMAPQDYTAAASKQPAELIQHEENSYSTRPTTTTTTTTTTSTITNHVATQVDAHNHSSTTRTETMKSTTEEEEPQNLATTTLSTTIVVSNSTLLLNHPKESLSTLPSDPILEVVEKILGPQQQQQQQEPHEHDDDLYKEYLRKAYSLFGWMEKLSHDEMETILPIIHSYVSMPTKLSISNSQIESSSSSPMAQLLLESRKDFLQLRNKVLKRWQSNMNYFKLRGKEKEARRCKKLMENNNFINFETCNHYFPHRFKFHRLFTSMTRKAQHNNHVLKMKILVTKISENDTTDATFRRISSIFYSSKFGHYHLSLVIGSTKIEWCDGSLVVATHMNNLLSDKIVFQYTCYKTSDAKEINRIIDIVADLSTKWNREKTYSMFFCSCQHFIVELLKACGINYQQENSIQEQLKRLRLYDRRIIFRRSFDAIPKTDVDKYFHDYLTQLFQSSKTDLSYDSVPLGSKDSIGESLQRIVNFFTSTTKTTIELFNRLELDCLYYMLTCSGKKSNSDHKLLEAFDRTFLIANKTEYIYISSMFKKHFERHMKESQQSIDEKCVKQILKHSRIEQKYFELIYEFMKESKYEKESREEFAFICQQMKRFWLVSKISSSAFQMSYQETQTSVENLQWNCPELSDLSNLKECKEIQKKNFTTMWDRPRESGVHPDPKIEAFANYRDNLHRNFKFTPKNTFYCIFFVGVLPYWFLTKLKQDAMNRQAKNGSNFPIMNTTFNGEKDGTKIREAYKKLH
ncbi:hypothetical protein C9374_009757 [Naegleria lovaniensis]|uniref:NADH dehydrogenase [ubiquinone] 1 beta subcomplex subunit 4 n=1 Tax=Naegleria lovaniensis TaxID=51637 RepID=A0AA88H1R9_NAELO|nr:uncharacterized protein C9374_009757 [Naegleria lovaniensis]KAG2393180.1 hypothetical protein C9374_009757 [Naegleria lovaniensis]